MRLFHAVFFLTIFLFMWFQTHLGRPHKTPSGVFLVFVLALYAFAAVGSGFFLQSRKLHPAARILRNDRNDSMAVAHWRGLVLVSFCCAENIAILGCFLAVLGASWGLSGPFYAAGLLLLLAWSPRLELLPN